MYIKKLKSFLKNYKNYKIIEFLKILEYSNKKWFNKFKFEKDFIIKNILWRIQIIVKNLIMMN